MSETSQTATANGYTFVYAIHIAAAPEKVWQALTDNEFVEQYFPEFRFESDWKAGSPISYYANGKLYSVGEIVESDPPRKLVYLWPEPPDERTAEHPERLTWEIEESGPGTVMLKITHEQLTEKYFQGVSEGWPAILSSMKSLLETGKTLAFDEKKDEDKGMEAVSG